MQLLQMRVPGCHGSHKKFNSRPVVPIFRRPVEKPERRKEKVEGRPEIASET